MNENMVVEKLKLKYDDDIKCIKNNYYLLSKSDDSVGLIKNMKKHQQLIIELINDILNFYDDTKLCDYIFLNGSFARGTCTYSSDVDFNMIYDDKYKDLLFPIELRINYILSRILNFRGCDRVHTMMVYTKIVNCEHIKLSDDNLIIYNNEKINYFCRENYEQLLDETVNTKRDYNTLTNYLCSNIESGNIYHEWLYNFLVLKQNNDEFTKMIESNFKKSKNSNIKDYIENKLNEIISEYKSCDAYNFSVAHLKKRYKANIINKINDVLLIVNYIYCPRYTNTFELMDSDYISPDFKNNIILTLKMVSRLQIVLDKLGYDLSSHSSVLPNGQELYTTYKDLYDSDFVTDFKMYEDTIYKGLINELKNIEGGVLWKEL